MLSRDVACFVCGNVDTRVGEGTDWSSYIVLRKNELIYEFISCGEGTVVWKFRS